MDRFVEKSCRKHAPKASLRPLFKFGKYPQNNHCMQEIVFKKRYFESGFSKSSKKLKFIFSLSENHNHWVKLKEYNVALNVFTVEEKNVLYVEIKEQINNKRNYFEYPSCSLKGLELAYFTS